MMKKLFKWLGFGVAGLIGLLIIALIGLYLVSGMRLSQSYVVQPEPVALPTAAAAIAEGQRQYITHACSDCHGADGAGAMVIDDPLFGRISGSNLTPGAGGIGQQYSDLDWVRAIRHGVAPDGRALLVMPSQEYNALNDEDLGAMVAYLKSLPPVDNTPPANTVGPLGRVLLVTEVAPILPAERVDHAGSRPTAVVRGATVEYGQYLAQSCIGCHGQGLSGGPIPGLPPEPPLPANLTPDEATGLGRWSEQDFFMALRTGQRPDGTAVDPKAMPWPNFKFMTDQELSALWLYLQSVPAKPFGHR
jgi:mono/diheme cytochrome c family protein